MSLARKAVFLAWIGAGLGASLAVAISAVTGTLSVNDGNLYVLDPMFVQDTGGDPLRALFIYMAAAAVYGALPMGAKVLYDIESWSILRATVIHFIITSADYFITGSFLRWFSWKEPMVFWIMLFGFIAVYFLIWLFHYVKYKIEISRINEELLLLKAREAD